MDRKDWPVKVYTNFETPDKDDQAFYASLSGQERVDMVLALMPKEHFEQRVYSTPRITFRDQTAETESESS